MHESVQYLAITTTVVNMKDIEQLHENLEKLEDLHKRFLFIFREIHSIIDSGRWRQSAADQDAIRESRLRDEYAYERQGLQVDHSAEGSGHHSPAAIPIRERANEDR